MQRHHVRAPAICTMILFALSIITLAPTRTSAQTLSLCGNSGSPPPIQHVIVVMLENQSYSQTVGGPNSPFQTSLADQCGSPPVFFGATHSSAANYLAVSGGQYPAAAPPGCGTVKGCATSQDNLYDQFNNAGGTWRGYIESMPSNCYPSSSGGNTKAHDLYSLGHNPVVFYTDILATQCQADDVAVPSLTATSGSFYNDLENQTLPEFSIVVPNTVNDSEGPDSAAQNEQVSDAWLQNFIGLVQASPSYQAGNTLVLVTYDEGNHALPDYVQGEDCTNQSRDLPLQNGVSPQESCHIPTFIVYPYTPAGAADTTFFDLYSITRTVEDIFGLPYLANAANATSLIGHFGIPGSAEVTNPVVSITSPPPGATVSGTVSISGIAASVTSTISQVQVSVDGGPPVTASGTTAWSTSIDTTTLANGIHTITATATDANGNTGSATEEITVANAAATSCPSPPAGDVELSGNVSVETSQTGWTGVYNGTSAVTRVEPSSGSYDGLWALQVAPKSGDSGTAGVNNASPIWVTNTTAGQPYEGSVFVNPSVAGEKVSLLVRETTPSGTSVGSHVTTITATTGWQQITSTLTAKNSGDYIRYSVYASNFASSAQNFFADCLSLWSP